MFTTLLAITNDLRAHGRTRRAGQAAGRVNINDYLELADKLPELKGTRRQAAIAVLQYGLRSMRWMLNQTLEYQRAERREFMRNP